MKLIKISDKGSGDNFFCITVEHQNGYIQDVRRSDIPFEIREYWDVFINAVLKLIKCEFESVQVQSKKDKDYPCKFGISLECSINYINAKVTFADLVFDSMQGMQDTLLSLEVAKEKSSSLGAKSDLEEKITMIGEKMHFLSKWNELEIAIIEKWIDISVPREIMNNQLNLFGNE